MMRNVGTAERYARLAAGVAAGAAALNATGWQRATLGTIAAAGLGTGLTRYCPINHAVGRGASEDRSRLEEGLHDAELRRQSAMASALGSTPSRETGQPRVTPESDVFGSEGSR